MSEPQLLSRDFLVHNSDSQTAPILDDFTPNPTVARQITGDPSYVRVVVRRCAWLLGMATAVGVCFLFDGWLYRVLSTITLPGDVHKAIGITEAFAHGFGVIAILACIYFAGDRPFRQIVLVAVIAFTPGVVANLGKFAFERTRPNNYYSQRQEVTETPLPEFHLGDTILDNRWRSFPSGHAAVAIGFAIGLAWLFPRGKYAFYSVGVLACFQRAFAGVHFLSDLVAGSCVAIVVSSIILRYVDQGFTDGGTRGMKRRRSAR